MEARLVPAPHLSMAGVDDADADLELGGAGADEEDGATQRPVVNARAADSPAVRLYILIVAF